MAEESQKSGGKPEPEPEADRPTLAPFLGALAIAVIVVIVIVLVNVSGGDGLTEDQRVGRAAVGQNDAVQRLNYPDFRSYTCLAQQGTEADFVAHQNDSLTKRGHRSVEDVTAVKIDGDKATAIVKYRFETAPDTSSGAEMSFVREDGGWKVCSSGPS
jgi:hypothetical protein